MSVFRHPRPAPASFTFTAVEPSYAVYGWSAAVQRRALEFSTLHVDGAHGFSITGSGRATVTTATLLAPAHTARVTVRDATGTHTRRLTADRAGRLTVGVSLGPSNSYQEYTPQAALVPRRSVTATVRIGPG